jgi:hypothetical protein
MAARPRAKWFTVEPTLCGDMPLHAVEAVLADAFVPYVKTEEKTAFNMFAGGDPGYRIRVLGEFYFDFLYLIRQEANRLAGQREGAEARVWHCPRCGEENPTSFDLCWNCQTKHRA